ncbi:hypothetical protein Tco_1166670 [Tanacetum coccineum]
MSGLEKFGSWELEQKALVLLASKSNVGQYPCIQLTSVESCKLVEEYEIGESSTARPTRGRGIDYGFVSTIDAEERRQGFRDVGYDIRDTWVDPAEAITKIAPMTVEEVNTRVTELAELHEHDTQDLYALLEDAQDSRSRISQRVAMDSQRVDLLIGDMMTLQETVWMVEEEAYASRDAWAHSIGLSQATHQELQTHRDHVYAYETHIQAHQAHLQLQSTLIQTHHQVYETRFQTQQAEIATLHTKRFDNNWRSFWWRRSRLTRLRSSAHAQNGNK